MHKKKLLILIFILSFSLTVLPNAKAAKKTHVPVKALAGGLKIRSIGPADTSGRIADIVVNPKDHSEFYVGVASGNIWKTVNNGITFKPVFEKYGTYSIGAMAIDPRNPKVVWAGTGENNHQRALAYGDGVYKSVDGGKSWKNMGLKDSRQIGRISEANTLETGLKMRSKDSSSNADRSAMSPWIVSISSPCFATVSASFRRPPRFFTAGRP